MKRSPNMSAASSRFREWHGRASILPGIPPQGNPIAARAQFSEFLELWKHADPDLPEIAEARRWAQ
jgi:hypothetical protein